MWCVMLGLPVLALATTARLFVPTGTFIAQRTFEAETPLVPAASQAFIRGRQNAAGSGEVPLWALLGCAAGVVGAAWKRSAIESPGGRKGLLRMQLTDEEMEAKIQAKLAAMGRGSREDTVENSV